MLKQDMKFIDHEGRERTTTLHFNLDKLEITELQLEYPNGMESALKEIMESESNKEALAFIKDLVNRSYGEKDADGVHFDKRPEVLQRFQSASYYPDFLFSLFQDGGKRGFDFIKGVLPADLVREAMNDLNGQSLELSAREKFAQRHRAQNTPEMSVIDTTKEYTSVHESEPTQKSAADYEVTEARTGSEPEKPIFGGQPEADPRPAGMSDGDWEEFKAWQNSRKLQDTRQAQEPEDEGVLFSRPIHQELAQAQPEEIPIRRRETGLPLGQQLRGDAQQ